MSESFANRSKDQAFVQKKEKQRAKKEGGTGEDQRPKAKVGWHKEAITLGGVRKETEKRGSKGRRVHRGGIKKGKKRERTDKGEEKKKKRGHQTEKAVLDRHCVDRTKDEEKLLSGEKKKGRKKD